MVYILILLAPIIGGLIYGTERVVRARMQNRVGPPIVQPFYDFMKLLDKRVFIIHSFHSFMAVMHFFGVWVALALLLIGIDLLIVIFFHLLAMSFLLIGAYSVRSIYSHIGANRELQMMVIYEPIFAFCAFGFYMLSGSFEASKIFSLDFAPIVYLPALFVAFIVASIIKLKKSPFDYSDAHQEIIGGAEIEYSGIFFEALYTAKWLDYLYVYIFAFLFAGNNIWLGSILAISIFLLINLIDNSTTRIQYDKIIKYILPILVIIVVINLMVLKVVL